MVELISQPAKCLIPILDAGENKGTVGSGAAGQHCVAELGTEAYRAFEVVQCGWVEGTLPRVRAATNNPEIPNDDPGLNPYWPRNGATTFVDPDGYRLIISVVD